MMSIQQLQQIIANAIFQGDMTLAGLVMFGAIIGVILAITRNNLQTGLILMLPQTLFCSLVGLLTGEITILIVIVDVMIIAVYLKSGMSIGV